MKLLLAVTSFQTASSSGRSGSDRRWKSWSVSRVSISRAKSSAACSYRRRFAWAANRSDSAVARRDSASVYSPSARRH